MHIVAIAWIFVVLLMAVAEATSTQGSVLGALFTLLLYGALPLSIVLYVMGTPQRRRARLAAETAAERAAETSAEQPVEQAAAQAPRQAGTAVPAGPAARASIGGGHGSGQAAGAAVATEREEP